MTNTRRFGRLAAWVCLCFGCTTQPKSDVNPALAASSAPAAEPNPLAQYCRTACERAVTCGTQLATELSSSAHADELPLQNVRAAEAEQVLSCTQSCQAELPNDRDTRDLFQRSHECLRAPTCTELQSCWAALAAEQPVPLAGEKAGG